MFIAEIYESFQGEGPWAGTPSLFIRTSGCNLRCRFCDTPYTSWQPEGQQQSLEKLAAAIQAAAAEHVVITGGEPMLAAQLTELTEICRDARRTITIETAGTVDRSVECDLMAISPKRPNSAPDDTHDYIYISPHTMVGNIRPLALTNILDIALFNLIQHKMLRFILKKHIL